MNQGNGGLLALCGLLGVIAFGVLFVAPRFLAPAADQVTVEETASAPAMAPDASTSGPSQGDQTAEGRQDRAVAGQDPAVDAPAATAEQASTNEVQTDGETQTPAADQAMGEANVPDAGSAEATASSVAVSEPGFDLLRVEPDGSTVIAGRAEPGTRVDVMSGEDVLASADVGPSGDFAAVFDEPLEPGDYQLTLRMTGDDEPQVFSEEIATISIPRDGGSELLAMVTRPGEASRIVSAPGAAEDAAPTADAAASGTMASPAGTVSDEADAQTAEAVGNDAAQEQEADATTAETLAGTAETDSAAIGEQADVAALASNPDAGEAPQTAQSHVRIDAVEVEDDRLFVAGSSPRGTEVRVYADDQLVGDDRANGEGRFLVEGRMALAVGPHTIRADLIDQAGTVVARALVPFNRPEGGMAAAIAAADAPAIGDDVASASEPSSSTVETGAPAEAQPSSTNPAASVGTGETTAPGRTDRLAAAGQDTTGDRIESAVDGDLTAADNDPSTANPAGETDTSSGAGQTPAETETAAAQAADEPVTVTQEALTPSPASVIIRRGDTLWQISRRVYGQGVRYTTIYLANQQQIANPDRILPGQIFSVPGEALDNAEQLHRERLRAN